MFVERVTEFNLGGIFRGQINRHIGRPTERVVKV